MSTADEPLVIDVKTLKIDLEMRCVTCKGTGHVTDNRHNTILKCDKCAGAGIVLTKNGHVLLSLVRKYAGKYLP